MTKQKFEIPFGEHIFVLARPRTKDWSTIDGTTMRVGNAEWRPCKISGHNDGQRLYIIGSQYAFDLDHFEIGRVLTQELAPAAPDLEEPQSFCP
jgi:hypothetical protein